MKTLTIQLLQDAHAASISAAQNAAFQFSLEYPEDWGSCGGAWVQVAFGRKRKAKELFLAAGVIKESSEVEMYGKKAFTISVNDWQVIGYRQQNAGYKESALRAYMKTFTEMTGVELYMHTWCD